MLVFRQDRHGADLCRFGLPHHARAVPFLRPGRLPGNVAFERRLLAVVPKIAGLTALVRIVVAGMAGPERVAARAGRFRLGGGADVEPGDDDAWQPGGPVAAEHPPAVGLFVDRPCRLHADRRRGGDWPWPAGPGGTTTVDGIGAMLFYVLVYAVATLGAFALLAWLGDERAASRTRSTIWPACGATILGRPP